MEEGQQPDVCLYIHPIFVSLKAACSSCKEDSGEGDFLVCFCLPHLLLFGIMFVRVRRVSIGWWGLLAWEQMKIFTCERASFAEGVLWSARSRSSRGQAFGLTTLAAMSKVHKNKNVSWVSTASVAIGGRGSEEEDFYVLFYFTNFY